MTQKELSEILDVKPHQIQVKCASSNRLSQITMRALFSTVFMIIAIVAMIIGILLIVSSINSISNDPTASEITDIGESVIGAVASICLAVIIFIIAYILIILTATATYAGLRQVEGVHKRRMAGW